MNKYIKPTTEVVAFVAEHNIIATSGEKTSPSLKSTEVDSFD